jgi:beta-xylosidase
MPDYPPVEYRNPVLNSDWPDLDVTEADGSYWLVASSSHRVPALPLLRSDDLVTWERAGHAMQRLPLDEHYQLPRRGSGMWAPSIRHHDGRLFVMAPDPDHGIWVTTAETPTGPWSTPHLLLAGQGLIDPCPFWDEDGSAWVVFAWARSRSGINNRLSIAPVTDDLRALTGPPRTLIEGADLPGCTVLEGPKVYRRDGWYWIFAPAGGVTQGWQYAFRSRNLLGPYEERVVLAQGNTAINGPHQGAWVTGPDGTDWFLHFQDRGPVGRVVHLQPMHWDEDGWPIIGNQGEPVATHAIPQVQRRDQAKPTLVAESERTELWTSERPGSQWHWQANPQVGWLRTDDGRARLTAVANDAGNLRVLPQVLAQTIPGKSAEMTVPLNRVDGPPGTRAGVAVLGRTYAWAGLRVTLEGLAIEAGIAQDGAEEVVTLREPVLSSQVEVRVRIDDTAACHLDVRTDDGPWRAVVADFPATADGWVGAELGVFATSPIGATPFGSAELGAVTFTQDAATS